MTLFFGLPLSPYWCEFFFLPAGGFAFWVNRGPTDMFILECSAKEISYSARFKIFGVYGDTLPTLPQWWLGKLWWKIPKSFRRYLV